MGSLKKTYDDFKTYNSSENDIFVVEQPTEDGLYIFTYCTDSSLFGKCENCYNIVMIKFPCPCKKVGYCSLSCKEKDDYYHLPKCEYENRIDFTNMNFEKQPLAK